MISEAKIRKAFSDLSYDRLCNELADSTDSDLEVFLGLFIRSSQLFFKYPNSKKEKLRDELFDKLERYFDERCSAELLRKLQEALSVLKRTEVGYRKLLALLEKLPARSRSPEIQCSAALQLAVRRLGFIDKRAWAAIAKTKGPIIVE